MRAIGLSILEGYRDQGELVRAMGLRARAVHSGCRKFAGHILALSLLL